MSDYRLEFGSVIGPNDTERLNYILSIVSPEDELVISMNQNDPAQVDTIVDVLRSNDFDVLPKGADDGNRYHIIAHRKQ